MSLPTYENASRSLTTRIICHDAELMAKMYEKNINVNEMYQMFRERLSLYENASGMPLTDIDRLFLDSKKIEVSMELKMFRFKQHGEEEMSQILSRLEKLETDLTDIKEKQKQELGIGDSDSINIIMS